MTSRFEGKSRGVSGSRFRGFWTLRLVLFVAAAVAIPSGLFLVSSIRRSTVAREISWICEKVKPLVGKGLESFVNKYAVSFPLRFSLKGQRNEISKAAFRNGGLRGYHSVKGFEGDCLVECRCFGDKAATEISCCLCVYRF